MEFKTEKIITAIMIKCSYTEPSSKPTFTQSGSRSRVLFFFSVCMCASIHQVVIVQMRPITKCCMALITWENERPVNGFMRMLHYGPDEPVSFDSHVLSHCIDFCIMHRFLQRLNTAFQEFLHVIIKQQLAAV